MKILVRYFAFPEIIPNFALAFREEADAYYNNMFFGEMVEWSITTVLKTVVPRGTGGSNPSLSANRLQKDFTRVVNLAFKN